MFNSHLGNVFQVYAQADRWDRELGLKAYAEYHQVLLSLSADFNVPVDTTCAVFAAISPNVTYVSNLRAARAILEAYRANRSLDSLSIPIYKNNQRKAWSILADNAEPLDLIRAPKTRSFYLNLANPPDARPVTIDGHMYSVWNLKQYRMREVPRFNYEHIARDFRQCATLLNILPNQLQAVCWFAWRRIHNLFTDKQPSLFEAMPLR